MLTPNTIILKSSMKRAGKRAILEKKKNILLHSADKDLMKSLSILLQDQYEIVATETVEELALQRNNKCISLLVVDLERSIPALLAEFEQRRLENSHALLSSSMLSGKASRNGKRKSGSSPARFFTSRFKLSKSWRPFLPKGPCGRSRHRSKHNPFSSRFDISLVTLIAR